MPALAAGWLGIHPEGGKADANSEKDLKDGRYAHVSRTRPLRRRPTSRN